jgi:chorismate mutase
MSLTVRAVRGATQVEADDPRLITDAVVELVTAVLHHNGLTEEDLISVFFTMTPDLRSEFPAAAARQVGLADVPLLCASEIGVPGALPRVVRLMAHAFAAVPRSAIRHVYLHGAVSLRPDLVLSPPPGR